jgi:hypothetical protein
MESNTVILISSLIINVLMIVERFMNRIKKSSCFGSTLELSDIKNSNNFNKTDNNIDINKIYELINNNIKKDDVINKL